MARWKKWLIAAIVAASLVIASVAVGAGSSEAACQGARNCSSGWYGSTYWDDYSGHSFDQNIAVSWFANDIRRVYLSGSTCATVCYRHDYMRIYYRLGGPWVLRATFTPGPSYGAYTYIDLNASNPTQAHDWIVQGCSFGRCYNTPIIKN